MSERVQFEVIVDTREKNPWELSSQRVIGKEYRALDTGDYTVKGIEDKFTIDRKASVSELANNITQKRFKNELERIREFPYAFIVLEASCSEVLDYPHSSDLSPAIKKKIRINGKYLMRCLCRMQIRYNFNIIFADNRQNAQIIAVNLMEDIYERYKKRHEV